MHLLRIPPHSKWDAQKYQVQVVPQIWTVKKISKNNHIISIQSWENKFQ